MSFWKRINIDNLDFLNMNESYKNKEEMLKVKYNKEYLNEKMSQYQKHLYSKLNTYNYLLRECQQKLTESVHDNKNQYEMTIPLIGPNVDSNIETLQVKKRAIIDFCDSSNNHKCSFAMKEYVVTDSLDGRCTCTDLLLHVDITTI